MPVSLVTRTSEALSIRVVKKSCDILPSYVKLGGYAIKEGKKITKASLISKGRLQAEGFLTSCFLICCSISQGFLLTLWGTVSQVSFFSHVENSHLTSINI